MDEQQLETKRIQLRKNQNILIIVGMGAIAFAAWDFIKMLLMVTLQSRKLLEIAGIEPGDPFTDIFFFTAFILIILFLCLIRVYIGRTAIREGRDKKVRSVYVFFAAIAAAVAGISFLWEFIGPPEPTDNLLDVIAAAMMELTSALTMFELVIAAIRVRKVRKELEEAAG